MEAQTHLAQSHLSKSVDTLLVSGFPQVTTCTNGNASWETISLTEQNASAVFLVYFHLHKGCSASAYLLVNPAHIVVSVINDNENSTILNGF